MEETSADTTSADRAEAESPDVDPADSDPTNGESTDAEPADVDSSDAGPTDGEITETGTVVGDPIDADVEAGSHVVVIGFDAWTDPVLAELADLDASVSVIVQEDVVAERLRARELSVVVTEDVDEACFRDAGIERADAVLVATLDDQLNVLAVLTVMNVDASMRVVTFAGEQQDVPKLRAAGADRVVSLGQAVGELLVEVALSERLVSEVVRELVGERG